MRGKGADEGKGKGDSWVDLAVAAVGDEGNGGGVAERGAFGVVVPVPQPIPMPMVRRGHSCLFCPLRRSRAAFEPRPHSTLTPSSFFLSPSSFSFVLEWNRWPRAA